MADNVSQDSDKATGKERVSWTCPICKASGYIDIVNDADTAIYGMREAHKILSPGCPNSKDLIR